MRRFNVFFETKKLLKKMGAGASFNILDEANIRERFSRTISPGIYANASQIGDILPENTMIDTDNVAVLYVLDDDCTGRFTLEKILDFSRKVNNCRRVFRQIQFSKEMEGYCTLRLWKSLSSRGNEHFVRWFATLVKEVNITSECCNNPCLLGEAAIKTVHRVLKVKEDAGLEFREFTEFLREEEEDSKTATEKKVSVRAVETLASSFVKGIRMLMDEVGFETHKDEPTLSRCFGEEEKSPSILMEEKKDNLFMSKNVNYTI